MNFRALIVTKLFKQTLKKIYK